MKVENKRLFVGIPIEPNIKDGFEKYFSDQKNNSKFRWTPGNNLHITLVFKGDTPLIYVPEIKEKLGVYFQGKPQFDLVFQEYTFMPHRNPRMFWAQFQSEPLFKMMVLGVSQILKVTEDRSPIPHITLARFKEDADYQKINLEITPKLSRIKVDSIHLYESVLKPEGAEYTILDTYMMIWCS